MSEEDDFLLEIRADFIAEAIDMLSSAEESFLLFERNPLDDSSMANILRLFHSIKGGCKAVGYDELAHFSHLAEDFMISIRKGQVRVTSAVIDILLEINDSLKNAINSLQQGGESESFAHLEIKMTELSNDQGESKNQSQERIDSVDESVIDDATALKLLAEMDENVHRQIMTEEIQSPLVALIKEAKTVQKVVTVDESIKLSLKKVDQLVNSFGEQVINQAKLIYLFESMGIENEKMKKVLSDINKSMNELQDTVIQLRMINLKGVFNRLDRVVRETEKATSKEIEFIKEGIEQELDKTIVDALVDPLTHMVRNSIDHGIESREIREIRGKPAKGKVRIKGYQKAGKFYLELEDDGNGLDHEIIAKKAIEKGIVRTCDGLSKKDIYNLIFENGFSTRDQASDVSGRGVGMDVVRKMFTDLKGSCEIDSELGVGTTFKIELPLSLSLFNGIVIEENLQSYVIANADLAEIVSYDLNRKIYSEDDQEFIKINEEIIPLSRLSQVFNEKKEKPLVAILESQGKKYGLLFDDILGQERIVLKKIDPRYEKSGPYSGGVILGNGKVALVLEREKLIKKFKKVS